MPTVQRMGDVAKPHLLILHPMFLSAKAMTELPVMRLLSTSYHLVIPDIPSHGQRVEEEFRDLSYAATQVVQSLPFHEFHGALGFSLGARLLLEYKAGRCPGLSLGPVVLDGLPLYRNSQKKMRANQRELRIFYRLLAMMPGMVKKKLVAGYGQIADRLFEGIHTVSRENALAVVAQCATPIPDLEKATQEKCLFLFGEKEGDWRKCKETYNAHYPYAHLYVAPRCDHIQYPQQHPEEYVARVGEFFRV